MIKYLKEQLDLLVSPFTFTNICQQSVTGSDKPDVRMATTCSSATGKSFSEALILVSPNPQYDKRLFTELRVQYMKIPSSEHFENVLRSCCVQELFFVFVLIFRTIYVHNIFTTCSQYVRIVFWAWSFHVLNSKCTICCHIVG